MAAIDGFRVCIQPHAARDTSLASRQLRGTALRTAMSFVAQHLQPHVTSPHIEERGVDNIRSEVL